MTVDCDKYRLTYNDVKTLIGDKPDKEVLKAIGTIAVATSVPIIVVSCYVGELRGFPPELIDFIERLKIFYRIKHIINCKDIGIK